MGIHLCFQTMFAVIKTGGKQYTVREGQMLTVEKLPQEEGKVTFTDVLLVGGKETKVGTPLIAGATVEATIVAQGKGDKVMVRKYKAKVRYRRKVGHRQPFTKVQIGKITG